MKNKLIKLLGYRECYHCGVLSAVGEEVTHVVLDGSNQLARVETIFFCGKHYPYFKLIVGSWGRNYRNGAWAYWHSVMPNSSTELVDDKNLQDWYKKLYDAQ